MPTEPGKSMRVEHEYERGGAWPYSAALDVHRTKVFGRCEATTGIAPFEGQSWFSCILWRKVGVTPMKSKGYEEPTSEGAAVFRALCGGLL
jgi:hypothetical protein